MAMPDSIGSRSEQTPATDVEEPPALRLCECRPGKAVLIESGNSDGWIASDVTVDVRK
jgi:hypothetical protein